MRIIVRDMDDPNHRTAFDYTATDPSLVAVYSGDPPRPGEVLYVRLTMPDLHTHVDTRWRVSTTRYEVQAYLRPSRVGDGMEIDGEGNAVAVVMAVCLDPEKLVRPGTLGLKENGDG